MKKVIEDMLQKWFLTEPALFGVMCLHSIVENRDMACPVRVGRWAPATAEDVVRETRTFPRQLEYNPDLLRTMRDDEIDEAFRCEAVRILLKHPYSRVPDNCSQTAVSLGSNLAIGDNYDFRYMEIETPEEFKLKKNMNYEWYSRTVQDAMEFADGQQAQDRNRDSAGNPSGKSKAGEETADSSSLLGYHIEENRQKIEDLSAMWGEDVVALQLVDGVIKECERNNSWGSLSGKLAEKITGGVKATIDWRNILSGFRSSILSQKRHLTRMRPSRRFGFEQMGCRRDFTTRLLVAMDVSGSISARDIRYFLGVVNSCFRYGFESVDLAQIDTEIKTVTTVRKAINSVVALGRGGTSLQPAIDYAENNGYDGLLVLTDGYAPEPVLNSASRLKVAWVCVDRKCYDDNRDMLSKSGKVCVIQMDYRKI